MTASTSENSLIALSEQAGRLLNDHRLRLVTAESCTGGWLAKAVTDVAGSSAWFERGFVTYSNDAKVETLGVRTKTLERFGAVSESVARAMADGALAHSRGDVAVAITGVAGPGGGTADKPVGLVWLAWARRDASTQVQEQRYPGDREAVRRQAVITALEGLTVLLQEP